MKTVLHTSDSRGRADHGWLESRHTFSFARYYDPERIQFGALRVLNDDRVAPGQGFGTHPHDNMEIISIPLEGDLEHKDSMGNREVIREGDVQVMSAGTGIFHSEYNANPDREVKFLQIWVIPEKRNVEPRYGQVSIRDLEKPNSLFQVVSPDPEALGVWIHQQAWFHMGRFDAGTSSSYDLRKKENGVYAFLLEGKAEVAGTELTRRDGLGIWNTGTLEFTALENMEILLMEVPMTEV